MIKKQLLFFALRWLVAGVGMWICISLFAEFETAPTVWTYVLAGLIFALVSAVVKPFVSMIAVPLAILLLGFWSVLLSVFVVWLSVTLLPGVSMAWWGIIATTAVMSVANSLANILLPVYKK